jgi:hypothetical protein
MGAVNRRITPMVKAMGMLKRFTPYGILGSAGMFALKHGLDKSEEYKQEFDQHWLNTLGYEGMPRLEMYRGIDAEADFKEDWKEYWNTHPDNQSEPL